MDKKKTIITMAVVAVLGMITFTACAKKEAPSGGKEETPGKTQQKAKISYYTCPMHHQIHMDHPGQCPICGMTLVPVYEETSPQGVRISPDRQQMIGLKTAPVMKKQAVKEIRTVGRVAFDPDLAVAEREYIEISKNVPSLKNAARSNLRLKGMSEQEIQELDRRGESGVHPTSFYLPGPNDSVWIYATLYQDEMGLVTPGVEAVVTLPSGSDSSFTGKVRAVDPVVDSMTRSVRARIEIPKAGGRLKPDTYVDVALKIDIGEALTVPKSAVIDTGVRKVVFIVSEDKSFQSRDIKTGPEVGDDIVVLDGLSEGDKVVSSGAFLVDSESSLKAAL